MKPLKLLFYITGHGFGHATRTIEVINRLVDREPCVLPILGTTVPQWLFRREVAGDFQYVRCENDVGALQQDWRRVARLETLKEYAGLIRREPDLVTTQADFAKRAGVKAIVGDIPAVAFAIAEEAGLPSVAITNFSWDWIYAPYLEEYPDYRFVVEHIRAGYAKAGRLLRLPFHGDLSAFPVIEDIPLVARRCVMERDDVLRRLGLDAERKTVLVYLGRFKHQDVLSDEMRRRKDLQFVSFDALKGTGIRSQDLVNAADVVVTKPGYGIVSECVACRTPILYTAREDFAEYDALVAGIKAYAHGRFVPEEDLLGCRWPAHLDALLATERHWPEIKANGAEVAAGKILEVL